jgi:hypothetical protein
MTLGQVHLELKPVAPPGGDRARPSTFGCGVAISERVLSATALPGGQSPSLSR